ncbi:MAG: tetratricopeptide repeat protein [Rubrobacter sp.]|nr:tetratricopeptide repeat protein [Rubrobacter sp.]
MEDADVASALNAHGTALTGQGLYEEAHAYLERALTLREDTLGEQDFDTSTSLLKLGILSQLRTHDDEAREYLERALAVRFALCGEYHAATELVRDNLRLLDG